MKLGSWQAEVFDQMVRWGIRNPISLLRGNAARYSGRYSRSFQQLLRKMREDGWEVTRIPGPRGGEYGAVYSAKRKAG